MTQNSIDHGLVPRARLGTLLRERREAQGLTVKEMARWSRGQFTSADIEQIERGEYVLDDPTIESVTLIYEINSTPVMPRRSRLVVDLQENTMLVGDANADLPDKVSTDDLLTRYLALVYLQRGATPGEAIPMRQSDMEALGAVFGTTDEIIREHTRELMTSRCDDIAELSGQFRTKVMVPAAGILIGTTADGALLMSHDA